MHHARTLLTLITLVAATTILAGCGGGSAYMPDRSSIGERQAASLETRAGEDSLASRIFDTYSPPSQTLSGPGMRDMLAAADDTSMLDGADMDMLDLDADTMSSFTSADLGSMGTIGATFDTAWEADAPIYGSSGQPMDVGTLAAAGDTIGSGPMGVALAGEGMTGAMPDPMFDDASMDEDPSLDVADAAMDDEIAAEDSELDMLEP
jgi:hypothetical protein